MLLVVMMIEKRTAEKCTPHNEEEDSNENLVFIFAIYFITVLEKDTGNPMEGKEFDCVLRLQ